MASCTMVNSRCVAGLSTGIRAFSAMATMINANSASPSDTLRPTSDDTRKAAMVESWVEPASSATVNTTMIMAGSASEAIIISRLEPMPPKLGPTSNPANAGEKGAPPQSAVMTMKSAGQEKNKPGGEGGAQDA